MARKEINSQPYLSIDIEKSDIFYEHIKAIHPRTVYGIRLGVQTLRNPFTRVSSQLVSDSKKLGGFTTIAWVDNGLLLPPSVMDKIMPIPSDIEYLYETAKYANGSALLLDKTGNAEYQFSGLRSDKTKEMCLRVHFGCNETGDLWAPALTPPKKLDTLEQFLTDLDGFKRVSEQTTNAVYAIMSKAMETDFIVANVLGELDKAKTSFVFKWVPADHPPEVPDEIKKLEALKGKMFGLEELFSNTTKGIKGDEQDQIIGTEMKDLGISFSDVGGQDTAKYEMEQLVWAIKDPAVYKKWGSKPPKGVLLHGPPGCGKTLLAKAFASAADAKFYYIKVSDIVSKWYGEAEQRMAKVFEQAQKDERAIIFFDELDSLAGNRDTSHEATMKTVSTMLQYIDGLKDYPNVMALGATNRIEAVDEGMKRAGRFTKHIEVPVPDETGRLHIFKIHAGKAQKIAERRLFEDFDYSKIISSTPMYSGADIEEVVRRTLEGKARVEKIKGTEPTIVSEADLLKEISCYEHTKKKHGKIGYEATPFPGTSHT